VLGAAGNAFVSDATPEYNRPAYSGDRAALACDGPPSEESVTLPIVERRHVDSMLRALAAAPPDDEGWTPEEDAASRNNTDAPPETAFQPLAGACVADLGVERRGSGPLAWRGLRKLCAPEIGPARLTVQ